MNRRYENPEVIGTVVQLNGDASEISLGDKVVGFGMDAAFKTPTVIIDIRNFKGDANLMVKIELTELVQAIAIASTTYSPPE